jgi:hypothetical protein
MSEINNTQVIIRKFEPFIKDLTESELTILNQMVVERIRLMRKANAIISMAKLNIGDRVSWLGNNGLKDNGIIIRLNHKTASVKTDNKGIWNISPQLLIKEN